MPFKLDFIKSYQSRTEEGKKRFSWIRFINGLLFVLITSYLLYTPQQEVIGEHSLNIGDIVKEDIIIQKDITVEDKESTEGKRKQALEKIVPIYEYDEEKLARARNQFYLWFQVLSDTRKEYIKSRKSKNELDAIQDRIEKDFGMEFSRGELQVLFNSDFYNKIDLDKLMTLVKKFYDKKILRALTGMKQSKDNTIKIITKTGEPQILNTADIYDFKKVKAALVQFIKSQDVPGEAVEFIASTFMNFIESNITFSMTLTQQEEQRVSSVINPALIKLKSGKIILRKGDEVTPEAIKIIKLIAAQTQTRKPPLANFFLIFTVLGFLTVFGGKFFKLWVTTGINKDKIFKVTGATLLLSALVYRASVFLFPLVFRNITLEIPYEILTLFYAVPFGFGALVIAFIFNLQSAVIFSFINAMIGGIICDWDIRIFLYVLVGNLAVSFGIEHYHRLKRSPIIKAAVLWMLPVNMIMIIVFHVTESPLNLELLSVNLAMGIFSALVCPILANFLIPIWEAIFKLVTDLKLIELTNLNLPIFREMLEKAPGTYHHSQMVASLSESAALDLGISPLLLTAMALYHDMGKIGHPQFFSENHAIYKNPHPNLSPRDSAKNIISHIPDGMERAEKIKLPPMISSAIRQHHGTKVARFFYDKAREQSTVDSDGMDEKAFRYPGEKPKNIENAIIMLADQVEAASKSLAAPTDEEIKNVISKIIDANMEENQFDECEGLTLKNLNIIAHSFLKKLSAIYHMRVSYPGFDFKEKDKDTNSGRIKTADSAQIKIAVAK